MANWKKLASGAAGAAGAGGLNVEEVFSTYLYEGNGTARDITNNIDLSTEGGMVWAKQRDVTRFHFLVDTERGSSKTIYPNDTGAEGTRTGHFTAFNTDGFSLGTDTDINQSGGDYASWTFRKAPKFFDVVTYTGDGTDARTVSHNLGVVPGMMIVKRTDSTGNWCVYHRSLNVNGDNAPETDYMYLNSTQAASDTDQLWDDTAPTATEFTLHGNAQVNASGGSYVAYLFAHNDGDGDFGPTGDQDIIKCGSYTGDDLDDGPEIDLGFEPQWLLVKNASTTRNWIIVDNMRGIPTGGNDANLYPNLSNAEDPAQQIRLTPTGFKCEAGGDNFNGNGHTMIYVAIRRGPMAVPESATDVFAMDFLGATSPNPPAYNSGGWPVDMGIQASVGAVNSNVISARLTQGKFLVTNATSAESTSSQFVFDFQDGWRDSTVVNNDYLGYMWKRAPNFFDVVAYTGNGTAGRTVSHNLGVVPEMMWVFRRNTTANRYVYHAGVNNGATNTTLVLDGNFSVSDLGNFDFMNGTQPTASVFSLSHTAANINNYTYIAYLFASLDGVSKVGSYTGNGGTSVTGTGQNIDCGFSNGARFVLIKPTNAADNWFLYDSERGIVAGNDATLQLNLTAAQSTSSDEIDPLNSGFTILNGNNQLNRTGRDYIFYAVA